MNSPFPAPDVLGCGIVKDSSAFRLSRIQAEGWNAARRFLVNGEPDAAKVAALNPHKADPERARWLEGFRNALNALETK